MALQGGTLQQLAEDKGTTVENLQKLNPKADVNTVYSVSDLNFGSEPPASNPTPTPTPSSTDTTLKKVATGSTDSKGNPIYDVFAGNDYISNPSDARLKGVNISTLPDGTAPTGFTSKFLPPNSENSILSDTSINRANANNLQNDITNFATKLGVTKPTGNVSDTVQAIIDGLKNRQTELDNRQTQDLANIEKSYATSKEQLTAEQQDQLAQAEGRTRIGGFLTKMEVTDIQKLQDKFRLEQADLDNKKVQAIQQAQRAYDDQNYNLANQLLQEAKSAEDQAYSKQQDYFNNIIKTQEYYDRLNKPLKDANQADIDQALAWMQEAPSAFKDIKPSDLMLGKVTFGEIQARYLDSAEYKKKISKEDITLTTEEQAFQDDLKKQIANLAQGSKWGVSYDYLAQVYGKSNPDLVRPLTAQEIIDNGGDPSIDETLLDIMLGKSKYYPKSQ